MALAGDDGRELARLLRASKSRGVAIMAHLVGQAITRFKPGHHVRLLSAGETAALADSIAAVNATAELLGRVHVRDTHLDLASPARRNQTDPRPRNPFKRFADAPVGVLATPEAAVEYFTNLVPSLGIDPARFGPAARRAAFTLAESANRVLTARVQAIVAEGLKRSQSVADASAKIKQALTAAGVSPRNPQYSEMVFRTNAMDAYQQGVYEEGRHPDVADLFPVWQYVGIRDGRQGADHEPHFGRYYPAEAAFADVRGPRPFNCRCSLRWVDSYEWDELSSRGARQESKW